MICFWFFLLEQFVTVRIYRSLRTNVMIFVHIFYRFFKQMTSPWRTWITSSRQLVKSLGKRNPRSLYIIRQDQRSEEAFATLDMIYWSLPFSEFDCVRVPSKRAANKVVDTLTFDCERVPSKRAANKVVDTLTKTHTLSSECVLKQKTTRKSFTAIFNSISYQSKILARERE